MSLYTAFTHLPAPRRRTLMLDIEAFQAGTLDPLRWPPMFQDILEAAALPEMSHRFTVGAQHCVDQKLCTYTGRAFQ